MARTLDNQTGIIMMLSGVTTIGIMMAFNTLYSPACSATRDYSVPFMILFQMLGIILSVSGAAVLFKNYFSAKTKRHRK